MTGRLDRREPKPTTARSARGVTPPTEHDHQQATANLLQPCGASHEVLSPTAHSGRSGPLSPEFASLGTFRLQGCYPPDGLLPDQTGRLSFKPERSWGCPLQSFFLTNEAVTPLDVRSPPDVGHPFRPDIAVAVLPLWSAATGHTVVPRALPDSERRLACRVCHLAGVRSFRSGIRRTKGRCSPGVRASSGSHAARSWGATVHVGPPPVDLICSRLPVGLSIDRLTAQSALRSIARFGCGLPALTGGQPS